MPNYLDKPWAPLFEKDDLNKRAEDRRTFWLPESGLSFIDDHFGPRPGCIHTLLGSTGRGKSTLLQSLMVRWGVTARMFVYLTEEAYELVEENLALKDQEMDYLTPNLRLMHEFNVMEQIAQDPREWLKTIKRHLSETEAKILIIDNITTCHFYGMNFNAANTILHGLRKIAQELNIPIFLIAHTKKGVSETTKGIIDPDDVRGTAQLANTSDYFYIFYRIRKTQDLARSIDSSFVRVAKSRHHNNQDNFYKLDYDHAHKMYVRDSLTNFNAFKSFMKERDRA